MAQRAEEGGVRGRGGEGRGWGLGGEGPCVGAAPPLRAAHSPRPLPPRRPPPPPPLPSLPRRQEGKTALDRAKEKGRTQVIALLKNLEPGYLAALSALFSTLFSTLFSKQRGASTTGQ